MKSIKKGSRIPVAALFDQTNLMLKMKFAVKHMNYVTDNGIVRNGWLLSNVKAVDEAIKLFKTQSAPIYIIGKYANAVISWDAKKSFLVGSLWKYGKEVENFHLGSFENVRERLIDWYKKSVTKDKKK